LAEKSGVTDSMMPEGVEHFDRRMVSSLSILVTDSMMPEGVEHFVYIALRKLILCDRFHDAGRR